MRAVLDTNIVISGLLWSGIPRELLRLAAEGCVDTLTSEDLIDELRDVLKREKFQKYLDRLKQPPEALVAHYLGYTTVIEPAPIPENAVRDLDDTKVLAAAVGGKATHIVSGDDDLLSLNTYAGIPILTARDFMNRMKPDDAS